MHDTLTTRLADYRRGLAPRPPYLVQNEREGWAISRMAQNGRFLLHRRPFQGHGYRHLWGPAGETAKIRRGQPQQQHYVLHGSGLHIIEFGGGTGCIRFASVYMPNFPYHQHLVSWIAIVPKWSDVGVECPREHHLPVQHEADILFRQWQTAPAIVEDVVGGRKEDGAI